jgi:hypothetical protein
MIQDLFNKLMTWCRLSLHSFPSVVKQFFDYWWWFYNEKRYFVRWVGVPLQSKKENKLGVPWRCTFRGIKGKKACNACNGSINGVDTEGPCAHSHHSIVKIFSILLIYPSFVFLLTPLYFTMFRYFVLSFPYFLTKCNIKVFMLNVSLNYTESDTSTFWVFFAMMLILLLTWIIVDEYQHHRLCCSHGWMRPVESPVCKFYHEVT